MAKKKLNQGTAIWIDEVGAINPRVFNVLKDENNILTISFNKDEIYEINKKNIRAKRVIIYKKSDGNIVVQNPNNLSRMNLSNQGIKTLRFNLQNSALQESKAAIYRWTMRKDIVDKLGPIFKLLFICIAVGVIGWAAFKYAGTVLEMVASSRLIDCSQLFPNAPVPIGIENLPVGVMNTS